MLMLQLSTLTRLQDLRLKVREIDVEGIDALRSLTDLRSIDLEVRKCLQPSSGRMVSTQLMDSQMDSHMSVHPLSTDPDHL